MKHLLNAKRWVPIGFIKDRISFVVVWFRKHSPLVDILRHSTSQLKAELWSIFIAIMRKSQINLQICVENGFVETLLGELHDSNEMCAGTCTSICRWARWCKVFKCLLYTFEDLLTEMFMALANYSIKVDELKAIFYALKCDNRMWKRNSIKLLNVLKAMTHRYGPDEFFSLPGNKKSVSQIYPIVWNITM
jgi:hypothetical protein